MVSIQQQCCTTNSHGLLTPKTHLIEINFRPFGVGVGVGVGVGNVILVLLPGAAARCRPAWLEPDPTRPDPTRSAWRRSSPTRSRSGKRKGDPKVARNFLVSASTPELHGPRYYWVVYASANPLLSSGYPPD